VPDSRTVLKYAESQRARRGVRLTTQRLAVLQTLREANHPLGAYELLERLRGRLKNPVPPTVYRALEFLQEQGLAHKIESLHAYVGCSRPEHPHAARFLICSDCGEACELSQDVDDEIARSLQAAGDASGFEVRHSVVEMLGTCADCARKASMQVY